MDRLNQLWKNVTDEEIETLLLIVTCKSIETRDKIVTQGSIETNKLNS